MTRSVCVVGAGVAGLVAAKVLRADGFRVVVFEKEAEIGGVWARSRAYPGLRTNDPREAYVYSDFPHAAGTDDFPTAEQMRAYLEAYADQFGLWECIRLGTRVERISREAGAFRVEGRRGKENREAEAFDFVAVCSGVFSEPYVPRVEQREGFAGCVLHSSEVAARDGVDGRRVVVVGAGKSALDCAVLAARRGRSCTLVYRQPHWMVPRYLPGRVRLDKAFLTRATEMFLRYYHQRRGEAWLHSAGRWLVTWFWRVQSRLVRWFLKVPRELVPRDPLPKGFENIGVGSEFYETLHQGRLALRRAGVRRFAGAAELELDTGEQLEADTVIFATGWRQDVRFLDEELRARVRRNGVFHLYRNILPPEEPRLGFLGYASSVSCPLTAEIGAHWLSQCFRGELALPPVAEMDREIEQVRQWSAEVFPARKEGYFVGPYLAHYVDDLMEDMGLRRFRTGNVLEEYFGPLWARRYRGVGEERRRMRAAA